MKNTKTFAITLKSKESIFVMKISKFKKTFLNNAN